MTKTSALAMFALCGAFAVSTAAQAQVTGSSNAAPTTRAQVKMERTEFLKSHRWDPTTDTWVLKPGFEPPEGLKSRDQIKAERVEFLSKHRWNGTYGNWVPLGDSRRNLSSLPRAQVKEETAHFLKTHQWDETKEEWVARPAAAKKRK